MLTPDDDDGPVTVYLTDGNELQFDRVFHTRSGMVQCYDVHKLSGNRVTKGNRAKSFPRERIEEIEYTGFGE